MNARDELKFVLASREDYEWATRVLAGRRSARASAELLSRPSSGSSTRALAEWIIDDRLPVRFQLQQHKELWEPDARGV